jgi:regulatory factor X 1/2/3
MVPAEATNNGSNDILDEGGSDSGGHNSLSHATRISPATVRFLLAFCLIYIFSLRYFNKNLFETIFLRQFHTQVQWLVDNYETADGVSLPRSNLYHHYLRHCTDHKLDPVNAASFGKLIRSVFIGLRTRRLGTR